MIGAPRQTPAPRRLWRQRHIATGNPRRGAGNSIGTLTVQGNLVLTAAAVYMVEVSATQADRTNITGTATLAGTVQAVFGPASYARSYTILSAAGGRSGTTFAGVTSNLANFNASLSYTPTDVLLNIAAALGAGTPLNQNPQNVASTLNTFFNNGGTLPPGFRNVFGLTGSNLGNALTLLTGEPATGAQQGAFKLTDQCLGLMLDHRWRRFERRGWTRSELGSRFDHVGAFNQNAMLTLRGRLAWAHDWVSNPALAAAFLALPGTNFILNGATPAKNSALTSAGAELRLANGVTLLGEFDGEFARGSHTYAGTGTLRWAW